jgi:pimeloyl-ACP methyl ester carboxylesterase
MTDLSRHWPSAAQKLLESRYSKLLENPDHAIAQFKHGGSLADRELLEDIQIKQFRLQNLREASQLPTSIFARELITLSRSWGFNLSEIKVPVILWHGRQDDFFPVEHAEAIASILPNCQAHFNENWGHFFLYREWENILKNIVK